MVKKKNKTETHLIKHNGKHPVVFIFRVSRETTTTSTSTSRKKKTNKITFLFEGKKEWKKFIGKTKAYEKPKKKI